jgi:uncharacterized protein
MDEKAQVAPAKFVAALSVGRTMLPTAMAILIYVAIARVLMAPYAVKSLAKVVLFLGVSYFCLRLERLDVREKLARLFKVGKEERLVLLRILLVGSCVILAVNLLARPLITAFGLVRIMSEIKARAHTSTRVFMTALVHIPLVNALVEELFFRGFLFLHVYEQGFPRAAMFGSASLFAIYHMAIFRSWFPWPVLIMVLYALFLAGILFNHLLLMWKRITVVWLLHGLVNLAVLLLAWQAF